MDDLNHDALLMVDTISGLASINYEHDEWGVDITISGSQKGLMLPPGYHLMQFLKKQLMSQTNQLLKNLIGIGMNI